MLNQNPEEMPAETAINSNESRESEEYGYPDEIDSFNIAELLAMNETEDGWDGFIFIKTMTAPTATVLCGPPFEFSKVDIGGVTHVGTWVHIDDDCVLADQLNDVALMTVGRPLAEILRNRDSFVYTMRRDEFTMRRMGVYYA
jgi:hypothetical protein